MQDKNFEILNKPEITYEDVVFLLSLKQPDDKAIVFAKAEEVRLREVGNKVYLRGLVEYSNSCRKNCYYCGIRAGNKNVKRYTLSDEAVLNCARHAYENGYGSFVLQSGERTSPAFVEKIGSLLKSIKELSHGELGITLSCGEQTKETYQYWKDCGAHRYLLRFESSDTELYYKIHPEDSLHHFGNRMIALKHLRETGYQVGSGMMIGLPGQSITNLADDLMLLKQLDVDMVGMGPYVEHAETPLYIYKDQLLPQAERLELALLTIAVLRLLMQDINIATATALDSIAFDGRERAILAGANVLMPNLTPAENRENYFLYNNKPFLTEADDLIRQLADSPALAKYEIHFNTWGDSKHYRKKLI